MFVERSAIALPGAGRDERLLADAEPLRGVVAEEPVVGQGLAGDVAGDDGFAGLGQLGAGPALVVFDDVPAGDVRTTPPASS